jgi:hypothetical protein
MAVSKNSDSGGKVGRLAPKLVLAALLGLGILNVAHGDPILLWLGAVAWGLSLVYPYLPKRSKVRSLSLSILGVLSALGAELLVPGPARAQLFQNAETFFNRIFISSSAGISIVFNSLRGLFILYLAVSFVGVFNSVRNDEDWMTVARTPVIVVIVVTLADILTNLITGGSR